MPDNRRNLQTQWKGIEGTETIDKNGWPTPLNDPSNPLKIKVTHGSRGEQKDFKAMKTSRQDDVSLPEGRSSVKGVKRDDLDIDVKKTVNDSTK